MSTIKANLQLDLDKALDNLADAKLALHKLAESHPEDAAWITKLLEELV